MVGRMPPMVYQALMDAGFRRSGRLVYQPACPGCRACRPIRVMVEQFAPSKSQRRCWRRNSDLQVSVAAPVPTDEKYDLYRRYLREWHGTAEEASRPDFEAFLYQSPVQTIEFTYRNVRGDLLAVGICDICPLSISSVYCYFDPRHARRGLGTFSALREIEYARTTQLQWYYLGYWVRGCVSMEYKTDFSPYQLLDTDGVWRSLERRG